VISGVQAENRTRVLPACKSEFLLLESTCSTSLRYSKPLNQVSDVYSLFSRVSLESKQYCEVT